PPTDRNYLACRVNGKPVVFKEVWTFQKPISSFFRLTTDSAKEKTVVELSMREINETAFNRVVELQLIQSFIVFGDITKKDSDLFEKKELQNAFYFFFNQPHLSSPLIEGSIQITDFEYDKISSSRLKGNLSGVFEFTCLVLDPETDEIDTCKITDGVFNVIMI
ncbi:hypothetical protein, partial [uncultured Porphyromonas sp.]